jgi:hypothetical protein
VMLQIENSNKNELKHYYKTNNRNMNSV